VRATAGAPCSVLAIATGLSLACADESNRPAFTVQDSAGVQIVHSTRAAWPDSALWRVESDARLAVTPSSELSNGAPPVDAALLDDGGVAIATADGSLHVYTADGAHARTVARSTIDVPGSGASRLYRLRDRLVLAQRGAEPSLVFEQDGTFLHAVASERAAAKQLVSLLFILADSTVLALQPPAGLLPRRQPWTERARFTFFQPNGDSAMVELPGARFTTIEGGGVQAIGFGPVVSFAVRDRHLIAGFPASFDIGVWSARGTLMRRIRRAWTPQRVDMADVERARAQLAARIESQTDMPEIVEEQQALIARLPFADTLPAFGRVIADHSGNLWVERVPPVPLLPLMLHPTRPDPTPWDVFGPDGDWLGTVAMPAALFVTDIGDDAVAGVAAAGRLRVHRLVKTTGFAPRSTPD
jgi:hypothetical protein